MLKPLAFILLALSYPTNAFAQTISVQNGLGEHGFGWMFGRGGTCYIVMPKHVAGPFPRVTVSTAAPVDSATATVISPFWDNIDLSIGIARGGLVDRCDAKIEDLEESPKAAAAYRADLLRLSPSGELTRRGLTIAERSYLTFTGTLEDGTDDIAQGTSGAFAFVNGMPIGMAITSDDPTRARFMRSGEILIHLRRFLDEQAGVYVPVDEAASTPDIAEPNALPLRFFRSTMPPTNPQFAPENLVTDGQFIFAPQHRMSFTITLDEITPVSRLMIRASPTATQTSPKSLIVQWSVDKNGQRFREWTRAEMGPDGVFDTGVLAPRNLRYLKVIILDTWGSGDVVIDSVTAY
nr:hypothetical protein [uncultured Roseovarius sp.]